MIIIKSPLWKEQGCGGKLNKPNSAFKELKTLEGERANPDDKTENIYGLG